MRATRAEQLAIRRCWNYLRLRFRANGTVEAQRGHGDPWGILYDAPALARHLTHIRTHLRKTRP